MGGDIRVILPGYSRDVLGFLEEARGRGVKIDLICVQEVADKTSLDARIADIGLGLFMNDESMILTTEMMDRAILDRSEGIGWGGRLFDSYIKRF
ncbi:MAG: hypothetical protein JXB14_00750 [Candidatus Altiarchaeota archaeon]|nr:hypothetical protein [Candidatus Altiarchaeota archaeon]